MLAERARPETWRRGCSAGGRLREERAGGRCREGRAGPGPRGGGRGRRAAHFLLGAGPEGTQSGGSGLRASGLLLRSPSSPQVTSHLPPRGCGVASPAGRSSGRPAAAGPRWPRLLGGAAPRWAPRARVGRSPRARTVEALPSSGKLRGCSGWGRGHATGPARQREFALKKFLLACKLFQGPRPPRLCGVRPLGVPGRARSGCCSPGRWLLSGVAAAVALPLP